MGQRLARAGHLVVLGARRTERLSSLAEELGREGFRAEPFVVDVTDRLAMTDLVREVVSTHGRVDAVVANAGVMLLSPLDSLLVDEWHRMVDVNVTGLLNTIGAVLPQFLAQQHGHLVTVASVGAHSVVPTSAVYSGTKYAAWAITEGMRQELPPTIRVTTISPGVTESELATHITHPDTQEFMKTYRRQAIPADAVARAVSYALDEDPAVDVNEIVVRPSGQRP